MRCAACKFFSKPPIPQDRVGSVPGIDIVLKQRNGYLCHGCLATWTTWLFIEKNEKSMCVGGWGGGSEKSIIHANDCYLSYFGKAFSLTTSLSLCDWTAQILIKMIGTQTGPRKAACNKTWGLLMGLWERLRPLIRGLFTLQTTKTSVSDKINSICSVKCLPSQL